MKSDLYETSLRDYLRTIFRHKAVIITTFVTVMITAIIGVMLKTPIYKATAKVLITVNKETESLNYKLPYNVTATTMAPTQAEVVTSYPVLARAVTAAKLAERPFDYEKNFCTPLKAWVKFLKNYVMNALPKFNAPSEPLSPEQEQEYIFREAVETLKENTKVEQVKDTDILSITVSDFTPMAVAQIANVISRSYVIFDLEQQLAELQTTYGEKYQGVTHLREIIDNLTRDINGASLSSEEAIGPASIKIIEQAQVPFQPSGLKKWVLIGIAFFMSIFLGITLTFVFEYIDQTFESPRDVEEFFNLPILGAIPKKGFKNKSLIRDAQQSTISHQSYHDLSDQMYLLMKDKNLKAILITAISPLECSTTIAANLGLFLARDGHKVLVIDANLKSPGIHEIFKIPNSSGLTHVLEGKILLEEAIKEVDCNLAVLTAGNTSLNPTLLFDSTRMTNIIKAAKEKYGMVFVDYANLRNSHDADILSTYLDGMVIVVNEGKTKRQVIERLITPLEQKESNIIGVILNNQTFPIPKMIYERL